MPLYEYRCKVCDHLFEKLQSVKDDEPPCPNCGGETMRLISASGLRFRGSGFHTTDYGKYRPKRS